MLDLMPGAAPTERRDELLVVDLGGTSTPASQLRRTVVPSGGRVIVDARNVQCLTHVLVAVLVQLRRVMLPRGGDVVLLRCEPMLPSVRRMILLCSIPCAVSVEDATRLLRPRRDDVVRSGSAT